MMYWLANFMTLAITQLKMAMESLESWVVGLDFGIPGGFHNQYWWKQILKLNIPLLKKEINKIKIF